LVWGSRKSRVGRCSRTAATLADRHDGHRGAEVGGGDAGLAVCGSAIKNVCILKFRRRSWAVSPGEASAGGRWVRGGSWAVSVGDRAARRRCDLSICAQGRPPPRPVRPRGASSGTLRREVARRFRGVRRERTVFLTGGSVRCRGTRGPVRRRRRRSRTRLCRLRPERRARAPGKSRPR
jgi:hypothetical protein